MKTKIRYVYAFKLLLVFQTVLYSKEIYIAQANTPTNQGETENESEGYFEEEEAGSEGKSETNTISYVFGKGLTIKLENGEYGFNLGGFLQPFYSVDDSQTGGVETTHQFRIHRARLALAGYAFYKQVEFLLDVDFTDRSPLFDAWIAYSPFDILRLSVGQKLTFLNNRSYYSNENKLQFAERSPLSENFTNTGREFGIFAEGNLTFLNMTFKPAVSVTSGDGKNSFGSNSSDVDLGNLKYGARLDFLPFGDFANKGDYFAADTERESSPKLAIGGGYSYNDGASEAKGDGHNQIVLYNDEGKEEFAAYQKIYASLIFKWQGISFLAEYVHSRISASDLYLDVNQQNPFLGESISDLYVLGQAFNIQLGYIFWFDFGISLRYTNILPEFPNRLSQNKKLEKESWYTLAISQYILDRDRAKATLSFSYVDGVPTPQDTKDRLILRVLTQVMF